jgi:hypothetical protein
LPFTTFAVPRYHGATVGWLLIRQASRMAWQWVQPGETSAQPAQGFQVSPVQEIPVLIGVCSPFNP